jgi:hypothetical protein
MPDPLQNPSPRSDTPAYPEHTADGSTPPSPPADGSQITEVIAKSGRGGRPAPVLRDFGGRIIPGSGRKP